MARTSVLLMFLRKNNLMKNVMNSWNQKYHNNSLIKGEESSYAVMARMLQLRHGIKQGRIFIRPLSILKARIGFRREQ